VSDDTMLFQGKQGAARFTLMRHPTGLNIDPWWSLSITINCTSDSLCGGCGF